MHVPGVSSKLCRTNLGLEPSVVPGAGHLLVDEEPVIVSNLITSLP